MCRFSTPLFLISVVILFFTISEVEAQSRREPVPKTQQSQPAAYSESALRRFEIVTLSSLPFTAIHSYAIVRGVKMYRVNKFSPELSPRDYRIMGIGAVSLSLFIGVWDWLHTRNVDRAAPRVPEPTPPPEEEKPAEGPIACLSETGRYTAATYRNMLLLDSMDNSLNRWANEPAIGIAIPLLQIHF